MNEGQASRTSSFPRRMFIAAEQLADGLLPLAEGASAARAVRLVYCARE